MALTGRLSSQVRALNGKMETDTTAIEAKAVAFVPSQYLRDLADVDTTNLAEGSVLIYNSTLNRFETRSDIENANTRIIGGSF